MKKMLKSNQPALRLVLRSVVSAVVFLMLFDFAASEIILHLDMSLDSARIAAVLVCALTAFCVAFVTCHGLKSGAFVVGVLSVLPLVFYSLINLIFNSTSAVYFFIKLALMLLCGALGGVLAVRRSGRFKV